MEDVNAQKPFHKLHRLDISKIAQHHNVKQPNIWPMIPIQLLFDTWSEIQLKLLQFIEMELT